MPPVPLAAVVTTRKPAVEENAGNSTQGQPVNKQHCSSSEYNKSNHILLVTDTFLADVIAGVVKCL